MLGCQSGWAAVRWAEFWRRHAPNSSVNILYLSPTELYDIHFWRRIKVCSNLMKPIVAVYLTLRYDYNIVKTKLYWSAEWYTLYYYVVQGFSERKVYVVSLVFVHGRSSYFEFIIIVLLFMYSFSDTYTMQQCHLHPTSINQSFPCWATLIRWVASKSIKPCKGVGKWECFLTSSAKRKARA